MPITLTQAILLDLDPINVSRGAIRIASGNIEAVGPDVQPLPGDEIMDCGGGVVLPGLVNGHTHLYSALAAGMPPPSEQPRNFLDILRLVWWRLDRALDAESIETSARIGAIDALRCGTTTLIDHHASPLAIDGSLDSLERGIAEVGLRAVLCYETTDRHGPAGAEAGLAENRRYLDRCRYRTDGRFAGLVGAHAAFTLSDDSLKACARLAAEYNTGVHIHVAEDPCDDAICRREFGTPLVRRLEHCGLLAPENNGDCAPHRLETGATGRVTAASIFAHGTHLTSTDAARISGQAAAMAHNPRSNMNNSVGYAPVGDMDRVMLGTDGIGGDMFTEARIAWFKARDAGGSLAGAVTPNQIIAMLACAAHVAGKALGSKLGRLTPDAAADVVVTDYRPATPLTSENAAAHLIFALGAQHVRDVLIDGQWALKDRSVVKLDAEVAREEAVAVAHGLWSRMQALAP